MSPHLVTLELINGSYFPGLPVGWSPPLLRLHHVGHPDDHREEATRRRRLHRSLCRPLHRLHPGLQEGHHHPHSEGNTRDLDVPELIVILVLGISTSVCFELEFKKLR